MRQSIIGGKFRGRNLNPLQGDEIRPTSNKMRGAIMNILRSRGVLDCARVLDVFCGTGALGLEALSQGAEFCTFVDKSEKSLIVCRANIKLLDVQDKTDIIVQDASALSSCKDGAHTLAFLDPPYKQDLVYPTLEALAEGDWLRRGAIVVIEAEKEFKAALPEGYNLLDERSAGDTKLVLARYDSVPE